MSEKTNDPNARKTRPPIQIYRPPGLRSGNITPTNNQQTIDSIRASVIKSSPRKESDQLSNASSESQNSTTKKSSDRPKKESIARTPSKKSKDDIVVLVQKLNLSNEESMINDFLECIESVEVTSRLSHFISRYAIEENKQNQRTCSQLSTILIDCPTTGQAFYNGLVSSLNQYFDCADKLRSKHFRVWLNYLSFLNDLYSNIGFRFENELGDIIFKVFNYLLTPPILQELKIEELECLIAVLLNLGSEWERECTSELSELKNLLRDALIAAEEVWSRKMVLLMLELSASNFNLSPEANEFYFQ